MTELSHKKCVILWLITRGWSLYAINSKSVRYILWLIISTHPVWSHNYQTELFEMFHNSIQLIHIFGSIYRENNIESTSCGIVLKLGFNQNNIISNFDLEAQILDLSLPFSETGRTFGIFHAFIKGANNELKKKLKMPEDDKYLSFFKK